MQIYGHPAKMSVNLNMGEDEMRLVHRAHDDQRKLTAFPWKSIFETQ